MFKSLILLIKKQKKNKQFNEIFYIFKKFVLNLLQPLSLDPITTFERNSLDGGGLLFKVIVNVFDYEKKNDSDIYLKIADQRLQILTIVEDIPESNHNLRLILDKLS